jgi:dCMP deaminase
VPSGYPHCIDDPCPGRRDPKGDTSRCMAIHAEQNALLQCRQLDRAHTIYSHTLPCFTCAKLIANTPIQRVVYVEPYADNRGALLLEMLDKEVRWYGDVG